MGSSVNDATDAPILGKGVRGRGGGVLGAALRNEMAGSPSCNDLAGTSRMERVNVSSAFVGVDVPGVSSTS